VKECVVINTDSKIIAREYPDIDTIVQALVLVATENVRQMNSDFLTEPDEFFRDGRLPTLKMLKNAIVDYIMMTIPDMHDAGDFYDLVDRTATNILKEAPGLVTLQFEPRRDL
jgi:hypothetical protein